MHCSYGYNRQYISNDSIRPADECDTLDDVQQQLAQLEAFRTSVEFVRHTQQLESLKQQHTLLEKNGGSDLVVEEFLTSANEAHWNELPSVLADRQKSSSIAKSICKRWHGTLRE